VNDVNSYEIIFILGYDKDFRGCGLTFGVWSWFLLFLV